MRWIRAITLALAVALLYIVTWMILTGVGL